MRYPFDPYSIRRRQITAPPFQIIESRDPLQACGWELISRINEFPFIP
jgi:hypothetical protein